MLTFISHMTTLDVVFIIVWIVAIVWGVRTGIIRQVFALGSILVAAVMGSALARPASDWTGSISGAGRTAILPWTYAFIVALVVLIFYVITLKTYPVTRLANHTVIDRVSGGVMGFFVGLVGITQTVAILLMLTNGSWAIFDGARVAVRAQLGETPFLPLVAETFSIITSAIENLLP
ncbi:MAG: hypothetical protein HW416_3071 [Chloroflexi bacterium]|nr:hypothetical protein [Chloroflexota bacterium]